MIERDAAPRIAAIDLLRGAAMVLMAIDHVRVFSGVPAGGPEPAIFFTRWVTHFCAPIFVFFAGTSAFFYGLTHGRLARFLVVRGAWLIVLELTVLRLCWTFNLDFRHYEMAGVIWAIGWAMIVLAGVSKLPLPAIAVIGVGIVFGHNLLDAKVAALVPALDGGFGAALWKLLYVGFSAGPIEAGPDGPVLFILYALVPWIGTMIAGYAFGRVLVLPPEKRNRACLAIGLGAIVLFLVLRGANLYGDPRPWGAKPPMAAWLSFLNTTKYPASLLFLLMTLGPSIAVMPLLERARGKAAQALTVFGRVPFFYYVLHIPLIHVLACAVSLVRTGGIDPWLFANHPMGNPPPPDGYTWRLPLLYGVWALAVVLLWFPCRWFAGYKRTHDAWWLRFV